MGRASACPRAMRQRGSGGSLPAPSPPGPLDLKLRCPLDPLPARAGRGPVYCGSIARLLRFRDVSPPRWVTRKVHRDDGPRHSRVVRCFPVPSRWTGQRSRVKNFSFESGRPTSDLSCGLAGRMAVPGRGTGALARGLLFWTSAEPTHSWTGTRGDRSQPLCFAGTRSLE